MPCIAFIGMQSATYQAYGHAVRVFDVRVSPTDPDLLASASDDTTARIWRLDQASGRFKQVILSSHVAEAPNQSFSVLLLPT